IGQVRGRFRWAGVGDDAGTAAGCAGPVQVRAGWVTTPAPVGCVRGPLPGVGRPGEGCVEHLFELRIRVAAPALH
ncbi:hypothetical protein CXF37_01235, partial [Corynebacterium bovis]